MRLFTFILLGGVTALLTGQEPKQRLSTPLFLDREMTDVSNIISPPPALDSKHMAKDLAEILVIQRMRSAAEVKHAQQDEEHEDIFVFSTVLGDSFKREMLPATDKLWRDVDSDMSIVVTAAKKHFQHPRPYDLDSDVKPVCKATPGGPKNSYPSGHGTTGYLSALLLSRMVPEKQKELFIRAEDYAHSRVVCGVHYNADLMASKEAAELIMGGLLSSSRFQKEFTAAKTEVRKSLGL